MTERDLGLYIELMIEAARQALSYTCELSEEEFLASQLTQDAVSMCLVVIGENARRILRIDPAFAKKHSNVPWLDMAHMRDRIAHAYEKLQMRIVWKTARTDLQPLLKLLEPILATLPDPDPPAIP